MVEAKTATSERGEHERLIDGAQRVIYEPGVARTTLAEGPARSRRRPDAAPVSDGLVWTLAPAEEDPDR
jgi:hypothetical protein